MKFIVAVGSIVLALSGPATARDDDPPWYRDKAGPNDERSCRAASGEWSKTPFFKTPFCRIKFPDGGKQCGRATDCRSRICVVASSDQRVGACHGEAERFATFWYLDENGKAHKISVE